MVGCVKKGANRQSAHSSSTQLWLSIEDRRGGWTGSPAQSVLWTLLEDCPQPSGSAVPAAEASGALQGPPEPS